MRIANEYARGQGGCQKGVSRRALPTAYAGARGVCFTPLASPAAGEGVVRSQQASPNLLAVNWPKEALSSVNLTPANGSPLRRRPLNGLPLLHRTPFVPTSKVYAFDAHKSSLQSGMEVIGCDGKMKPRLPHLMAPAMSSPTLLLITQRMALTVCAFHL